MRRVHVFLFAFLFILSTGLEAQRINFEKGSWSEALAKAKKEDKIVFVDCYTTWCGPCKWMDKNVFTDGAVAEFYNEHFVNVKLDMERGEGLDIATIYDVRAYPTLLFINGEGEIVHQGLGALPVENFLALGADAIDPNRQLFTLERKYESGDYDDKDLKNFAAALLAIDDPRYDELAAEYLDGKDWTTEENTKFIFKYSKPSVESDLFQYVLSNREQMIAVNGADDYQLKMEYAAEMDARRVNLDPEDSELVLDHFSQYFPEEEAKAKAKWAAIEYLLYSDKREHPEHIDRLKAESQLYMATSPDLTWNQYNALAWELHMLTYDKNILEKCIEWVDQSIALNENYFNTDTKAAILYKMGLKKEATEWAKHAIQLAKKGGHDPSDTERLLEKIKDL